MTLKWWSQSCSWYEMSTEVSCDPVSQIWMYLKCLKYNYYLTLAGNVILSVLFVTVNAKVIDLVSAIPFS